MDINIEQAQTTAHDCASAMQELALENDWMLDVDGDMATGDRRYEHSKLFFEFLIEDEAGFALRQAALIAEVRLVRSIVTAYNKGRGGSESATDDHMQRDDRKMLEHAKPQALLESALERVEEMQEMTRPVVSKKAPFGR